MQCRMPFDFPQDLPKDKPLSPMTIKVYKSRLNSLTKENDAWSDVPALKQNAAAICKHIDTIGDNSEKGRLKKRGMLQAIFAVLDENYRSVPNTYYRYWQKVIPLKTDEGETWLTNKKFIDKNQ